MISLRDTKKTKNPSKKRERNEINALIGCTTARLIKRFLCGYNVTRDDVVYGMNKRREYVCKKYDQNTENKGFLYCLRIKS